MENFIPQINNTLPNKLQSLENELVIDFVRSGGAGGQNVNKVSTKAKLRWNVENSKIFNPEEKELIKIYLKNRLTNEGDIILEAQEERSQLQNKERAIERIKKLVGEALTPEKERKATKPTKSSKEKRLEGKKIQS
ncbi:MAG: Class I peptide chain release factor, partial [Candidatus Nomurabacteria bacterium GW2011_GWB1_37_5]